MNLKELVQEFINDNQDTINFSGYDCSEIAEDLQSFLATKHIQSDLLTFRPQSEYDTLNIKEKNYIMKYVYHTVLLVNDFVIDVRAQNPDNIKLVTYAEYVQDLQDINTGAIIKEILNE